MRRAERITIFVQEIWKWFAEHKRELPWRDLEISDDTERAYQILVSEIMLQQTQVSRVKIVFKNFLQLFPKIENLAAASNADVVRAWRGMGYNNRALRLRDTARGILEEHGGVFPRDMHELQVLPGVGHYTAAAICNFAFGIPTPCLDTNIRRILHRTFVGPESLDGTWKKDDAYLLKIASEVLEVACDSCSQTHSTAAWHAALMDFGSLVCTKRNPKWDQCPLTKRGVMKAAYKVPSSSRREGAAGRGSISNITKEPGRMVGQKYIPNRIFRGKIVEELRDAECGLTLEQLGRNVCIDWDREEHAEWLQMLLDSLKNDCLLQKRRGRYVLE